ncbi:MAG: ribonuclease H-like domain-containing protein [Spirochaetota bacterium]
MNLKDKLKIYSSIETTPQSSDPVSFLESLGGTRKTDGNSVFWKFTGAYPLHTILPEYSGISGETQLRGYSAFQGKGEMFDLASLLFFDLETTSLSTGTGNYPFLTGIGYVSNDNFIVEQFFMQDYSSEPAILRELLQYFHSFPALVTFNGKSFDVPLLKSRYRLNRVPGFPVHMHNIDLLHPCRAMFRSVYDSCSLKTMEERSLGIFREDDIPGWLIPDVFFTFQKEGSDPRLSNVIRHNMVDITSMATLLLFIDGMYQVVREGDYQRLPDMTHLNIARHLYRRDIDLFIDIVNFCGHSILNDHSLFKKYSTALKRKGMRDQAITFWKKDMSLFSLEELAKHSEHIDNDYFQASIYCQTAFELIDGGISSIEGTPLDNEKKDNLHNRFTRRHNRLQKKIKNNR